VSHELRIKELSAIPEIRTFPFMIVINEVEAERGVWRGTLKKS
jgi:hypothetical protein